MRVSALITRTFGTALVLACVSQAIPWNLAPESGASGSGIAARAPKTGDCPSIKPNSGGCRQSCKLNETPQWSGSCFCKAPFKSRTNKKVQVCEPVCTSGFVINAAGRGCKCPAPLFLTNSGACVATCGPATFSLRSAAPTMPNKCIPCPDSKAASCSIAGSLSCVPGHSLTSGLCKPVVKSCKRSHYLDSAANACVQCADSKAVTCDASGALTCTAGRVIINKVCVIRITSCPLTPAAYLDPVANACVPCADKNALTCSATAPLSCAPAFILIGGVCEARLTVCAERFYLDALANRCVGCTDVNALACSASAASSCAAGFMLVGGACEVPLTGCAEQFYLDGNSNRCLECADANALSCSALGASSCVPGFVIAGGACQVRLTGCTETFYLDAIANLCIGCTDASALECSSTEASRCMDGFVLVEGTCEVPLTSCTEPAYLDTTANRCKTCTDTNALSCTESETTSSSCIDGLSVFAGVCELPLAACDGPAYLDTTENRCVPCADPNALSCFVGGSSETCEVGFEVFGAVCEVPLADCVERFYLDGDANRCAACIDPNALSCSALAASTCDLGFDPVEGECIATGL